MPCFVFLRQRANLRSWLIAKLENHLSSVAVNLVHLGSKPFVFFQHVAHLGPNLFLAIFQVCHLWNHRSCIARGTFRLLRRLMSMLPCSWQRGPLSRSLSMINVQLNRLKQEIRECLWQSSRVFNEDSDKYGASPPSRAGGTLPFTSSCQQQKVVRMFAPSICI